MTDLQPVVEQMASVARTIGQEFDNPNSDWQTVTQALARDGENAYMIAYNPAFFENEATKDSLVEAMRDFIVTNDIEAFVTVQSAWMLTVDRGSIGHPEARAPRPSTHPDREEVLIVIGVTADEYHAVIAPIGRTPDAPPTLGEWDTFPQGAGRFVEPLRDALQIARRHAKENA